MASGDNLPRMSCGRYGVDYRCGTRQGLHLRSLPHRGFDGELPYVVAIVELPEGPRIFTNIIGCSTDEVYCDMAVEVMWDDVTVELTLPKFRPVR